MKLFNSISDHVKTGKSTRELDHIVTNMLACLLSKNDDPTSKRGLSDFKTEGWKLGKQRYTTARKRLRDETFTNINPAKRGRTEISDELKKKIQDEQILNSRPAAKLIVTNPNRRTEKREGRRLLLPELHVILQSPLVKRDSNPDGLVSFSTFKKYRQWQIKNPSLTDGICHHCSTRRDKISQVHHQFPKTNPDYECKDSDANKGWHLHLWDINQPKYTAEQLLKKFAPLHDHSLQKSKVKLERFKKVLCDLVGLERHFRLAQVYLKRDRLIAKDFHKGLGSEWVRLTHDAKNPLVIGLGGTDGKMTTEQKRLLGMCACVGLMAEYFDVTGSTKGPKKVFTSNLSLNTDKTANATLQHFWHSLNQSPIKEILLDPRHTKLEISHDNAPTYKCKEFLYGATKIVSDMFPHIRVIRWAPMCPCHGKSDLDRRFTSFTSWINSFQRNKRIGTIDQMLAVLQDGAKVSNIMRREMGDDPIPTSFCKLELKPPKPTAAQVQVEQIKSMQCVTFIPRPIDRIEMNHSGWYINIFPWVMWKRGQAVPHDDIHEGPTARVLTAKQRKLKKLHKEAGEMKKIDFTVLMKRYDNRVKLLRKLKIDPKKIMRPNF